MNRYWNMRWLLLLTIFLTLAACGGARHTRSMCEPFFSCNAGTEWQFLVRTFENEPLYDREVHWPALSGEERATHFRGRFLLPARSGEPGVYHLHFRVRRPVKLEAPITVQNAVELDVMRDELGIYSEVVRLYWISAVAGTWEELRIYPSRSVLAPAGGVVDWEFEGYARTPLFTWQPSATGNLQVQRDLPRQPGDDSGGKYLRSAISETLTYSAGVGLTKLEQQVEGNLTMTWTLITATNRDKDPERIENDKR